MNMRNAKTVLVGLVVAVLSGAALTDAQEAPPATVESTYPGLVVGALASAAIGELPPGILLDMVEEQVTRQQVDKVLAGAPDELREQLGKNSVLIVQEIATKALLVRAARQWAAQQEGPAADKPAAQLVSDYLQNLVSDVSVDEAAVAAYYMENRSVFGGAEFGKVHDELRQFLLKMKRQEKADELVRGLSGRFGVVISGSWLAEQAVKMRDNPVDKARGSGLPTMVDFGADGCQACELMKPILKTVGEDYAGRANVLFVHVREDPVMAMRFGVQSIPCQVFFGKDGKETFRHVGFFAQEDIERKLAELGAK
jgi:thiol-disulfide isomerase/thioredoxin